VSPQRPLTYNPYIYGNDDPVDLVDPTGQEAIVEYLLLQKWIQAHIPYHWYRQDSNGECSSKHGLTPVGRQVDDPSKMLRLGDTTRVAAGCVHRTKW
jgi:hypothetical protein